MSLLLVVWHRETVNTILSSKNKLIVTEDDIRRYQPYIIINAFIYKLIQIKHSFDTSDAYAGIQYIQIREKVWRGIYIFFIIRIFFMNLFLYFLS
jgi:hypothetical protein